jgi:site-specific DNA recombinase
MGRACFAGSVAFGFLGSIERVKKRRVKMRAAIYARVSGDQQRGNYSIPTQINDMATYANKAGYTVVGDQFVDPGNGFDSQPGSGAVLAYVDDYTSLEMSRPSLDAAMRYLEQSGFEILLVHALDRMARDAYIRETLEREFEARGAAVEYVLGNYDESAEGEVRKDLDATFAKWENAKRVERCNRGKCGKANSGKFVAGRTPYGYDMDPESLGGLAVNEKEAEVVQWIFHLYVEENFSIYRIIQALNEHGIRSRFSEKGWAKSSVSRLLQNTTYIGYFYYNKNRRVNRTKKIERSRDEWIRIETTPIIDEWLFHAAKERMAENKKILRAQPRRFYLLSGKVFCAECDKPYMVQTAIAGKHRRKNDIQSYRHRMRAGHCTNHQISANLLEADVWEKIHKLLSDPVTLMRGYEESLERQEAINSKQRNLLETVRRKFKKHEQEKANLNQAYLDPDIEMTKAEYIEQKSRINGEIIELQQKIEELEKDILEIPIPEALKSLEDFAGKIQKRLQANHEPSPEDKRQILDKLHVKVYIRLDGQVDVKGWFGEKREGLKSITC